MLRKITIFFKTSVRIRLESDPSFLGSTGYRRAIALASELSRYAGLLDAYEQPEWLNGAIASTDVFALKYLDPRNGTDQSQWFIRLFRWCHRVECVLDTGGDLLFVRLDWYGAGNKGSQWGDNWCTFVVDLDTNTIGWSGCQFTPVWQSTER